MGFDDSAWGGDGRGGLKILVVDDEQALLESIRRGLFLYGYRTLAVSDGEEAIRYLREPGREVDLLITDLTVPGSSAFEVIQEARRLRPRLPILAITGLTQSAEIEAVRRQGVGVLQKPFCPDRLDRAVRALVGPRS